LNRIYGWKPDYFDDPNDLPEDMPDDLKTHIAELPKDHRKQIWVTCHGESPADREILGDIKYFPTQGFPHYFYPYLNAHSYLSPLVAVKFTRPASELKAKACEKLSEAKLSNTISCPFFFLPFPKSKSNHKY